MLSASRIACQVTHPLTVLSPACSGTYPQALGAAVPLVRSVEVKPALRQRCGGLGSFGNSAWRRPAKDSCAGQRERAAYRSIPFLGFVWLWEAGGSPAPARDTFSPSFRDLAFVTPRPRSAVAYITVER